MELNIAISQLSQEIIAHRSISAGDEVPRQYLEMLEFVYANGPTLPSAISLHLQTPRPTISRHLKKLKSDGYLGSRKGETDGREKIYHITNRGHSFMEVLQYRKRGIAQTITEALSEGEIAIFSELCTKAAAALNARRIAHK